MASALSAAAEAVGADLPALLDSASFCAAIMPVSPSNQAELQAILLEHMPPPATPTMRPNPAQGAPGASAAGRPTGTFLERMQAETAKHADQPTPPGSTYNR
jgi:predicted amidohydrolase YtcJ